MEDAQIVALFLARNEEAIVQTEAKYGVQLRRIAENILHDPEIARECENDAYFQAWNRIPPHEPSDYLFAFVGRIVRHLALDRCRSAGRQKRYALYTELTQEMQECLPSGEVTEAAVEAKELRACIEAFLDTCPEEQRNVFIRRYWYFDSIAAIADAFGLSQSKVKTQLFRMRASLKRRLEKEGYSI